MCKFVRVSCCLVFYNIRLPNYVVVELKMTPIKPQYMGPLNFYINVEDDTLRGEHDNKTIGLLLCNGGDKVWRNMPSLATNCASVLAAINSLRLFPNIFV